MNVLFRFAFADNAYSDIFILKNVQFLQNCLTVDHHIMMVSINKFHLYSWSKTRIFAASTITQYRLDNTIIIILFTQPLLLDERDK